MRAKVVKHADGYEVCLLEPPYAAGRGRTVQEAVERLVAELVRLGFTVYWRKFTSDAR